MGRTHPERKWVRSALLVLVLGAAAVVALCAFARALQEEPELGPELSRSELAARGAVTYRVYCRSCHGDEGRGDGPLAPLLKVEVPDLTTLARRSGGEFPEETVTRYVDGREEVAAHGPREMPIWGDAFRSADGEEGREEARIRQNIRQVVAHLARIQE